MVELPRPLRPPFGCHADAPSAYTALASGPEARSEAYRLLLREALPDDDLMAIRTYLQQQRALGRDDFRTMVEAKTQRFAGIRPTHRPPRRDSNGCK